MDDYNLNPNDFPDEPRARNKGNEAFRDAQIGIGILDLDPEEEFPDYLRQGRSAIRQRADIARSCAEAAAPVAGGGSVASHGSAAVFGRATRRTLEEITQDEVIVRKADRGVAGSKIFVSNRTAATQALSAKILGSVYLQLKNAAGENNQKAKLIQEQFVTNLDVVKKLRERMMQYDTT